MNRYGHWYFINNILNIIFQRFSDDADCSSVCQESPRVINKLSFIVFFWLSFNSRPFVSLRFYVNIDFHISKPISKSLDNVFLNKLHSRRSKSSVEWYKLKLFINFISISITIIQACPYFKTKFISLGVIELEFVLFELNFSSLGYSVGNFVVFFAKKKKSTKLQCKTNWKIKKKDRMNEK